MLKNIENQIENTIIELEAKAKSGDSKHSMIYLYFLMQKLWKTLI